MRIVDVNEFYSPTGGGVRTYIDRKMSIMADLGHELIVIAATTEPDWVEERPGGGRIHWVKALPLVVDKNYCLFWEAEPITRLLDELAPDVVETSSPWRPAFIVGEWQGDAVKVFFAHNDNMAAYPLRWFEGLAKPQTIEQAFGWYTRRYERFLPMYDAFVTNGPALAKRNAARGLTVHASMPLGIQRGTFSPDLRDETLRAALLAQCGLPPEGHLLLGLGRHHGEKRWPVVIDAVERAGADLPVGLILLGDGIERRALLKRVEGSPHIRLFRPVYDRDRFTRILASADALIHGSDVEPFGLVASEALASGLPLIVPDEGGCFEIAEPAFAETYRARDARSAAEAIRRLFAREPRILRAATLHAAARVRTDVDHARDMIAYYQTLIDARRARAA
ncbi:glycosyltransferase [Sphingomonas baiyangensis]|uniref:Glycosyltransferase family 1 protein n=1 Tax=Sphingomonas baiyangensis TaxID=2572576 RepID=A0A4U1L1D5_9SPHN|nr:glycosyltransferase [Sphingomonas baiyangensis]TKD50402.1 glycosyltransferase family 1 protein [Sphingomonas baiyangensis]